MSVPKCVPIYQADVEIFYWISEKFDLGSELLASLGTCLWGPGKYIRKLS